VKRRVLYISPGTDLGGGEISLLTLVRNLNRHDYDPAVLVYGDGRLLERANELDCAVHVLTPPGHVRQPAFVLSLAGLIARERIDIVHVNTLDIRAGLAAKLAGRRLVGHLRVIFPATVVDRLFARMADRVITVSNAVATWFRRAVHYHRRNLVTVYNGIDLAPQALDPSQWRPLDKRGPLVGYVGRIDPWKGVDVFLRAARQVRERCPDVRFLVVGDPGPSVEEQEYSRELRRIVRKMGLQAEVTFTGFRPDPLAVIADLDVLVVPSLELRTPLGIKTEGFGRVAAEGLAAGTPVVASKVGGLPEVLGSPEPAGRLVAPNNPGSLAAAVSELLESPTERERLAKQGRVRYQRLFSVEAYTKGVEDVYRSLYGR